MILRSVSVFILLKTKEQCEKLRSSTPSLISSKGGATANRNVQGRGRKYGLSLTVVSQRPSEVSETVLAQCSNFITLRLTNHADQDYVRRLLPDNAEAVTDLLPSLGPGECVVVGDAVFFPTIVQMEKPHPEPHSQSVKVRQELRELWRDVTFDDVISKWRRE